MSYREATRLAGGMPLSAADRLVMILCGFIPLIHVMIAAVPLALAAGRLSAGPALLLCPAALYLLPAVVVRACTWVRPLRSGAYPVGSPTFFWWWFAAQWQVVFLRLPVLEELLRLVPGLYSLWLRIWGAHIGSLVYWSPGLAITDRSLLRIGDRVIFGLGARLNAHVISPGADGVNLLYLAPIQIGRDTLVGAYSLMLPGCEIAQGEVTPPLKTLHPFTRWAGGRRLPAADSPLVGHAQANR